MKNPLFPLRQFRKRIFSASQKRKYFHFLQNRELKSLRKFIVPFIFAKNKEKTSVNTPYLSKV